jgi:hypothetical protein
VTPADARQEAIGEIADLFAMSVGFYPSWGHTRWVRGIRSELVMPSGNIDWPAALAEVEAALADAVALPPDRANDLPKGTYRLPPELYAAVAVGQFRSGWGKIDEPGGAERFVMLRCLAGKERVGTAVENAVCLQYRLWRRLGRSVPELILDAGEAGPLLGEVHEKISRRLTGG